MTNSATPHSTPTPSPDKSCWTPVRRASRVDGWSEAKQRRFIEVLADTGLVGTAARAVGLTRESAYRLRRAAGAEAFAAAWDAARHHAGGLIEDIAFERAIEGVDVPVFDEYGDIAAVRTRYDNRLLVFLLTRLRADRYGGGREDAARGGQPAGSADAAPPPVAVMLRAMQPKLPAPSEAGQAIQTSAKPRTRSRAKQFQV